jgi:AraC-like DNA-binding protein
MQNEKLNLTEIATRSGFNSSSYFCKVFKAEKGVSPTVYRKNLRGK